MKEPKFARSALRHTVALSAPNASKHSAKNAGTGYTIKGHEPATDKSHCRSPESTRQVAGVRLVL